MNVERRATPSGHDTLLVNGVFFHSRYDPVKEAQRLALTATSSTHVVILSPGLGYLTDVLAASREDRRILVVERHPELATQCSQGDLLVAPTPEQLHERVLDWEGLNEGRLAILSGVILDEDRAYYGSLKEAVTRGVEKLAEEISTVRAFSATWKSNLAANADLFVAANAVANAEAKDRQVQWLDALGDRWRGRDVAVLAAGPSLASDLMTLARAQAESWPRAKELIVMAVDSALPATRAAQVKIDYVISLDPQPVKAVCLANLGDTPLIASVLSPPAVLDSARRLFLFGQGHPLESSIGIPTRAVCADLGGSVATAAAAIAVNLGVHTVVLVGQDLAILDGKTHVRGTHFESALVGRLGRFASRERVILENMRHGNLRRVPAVGGGDVATTPILDSYRVWFRDLASRHPDVAFVQTSPRGASIGVLSCSLADFLWRNELPADSTSKAPWR